MNVLSNGRIKVKNEQYNQLPHGFEITLTEVSAIGRCAEDENPQDVPMMKYNFVPLSEIGKKLVNAVVQV